MGELSATTGALSSYLNRAYDLFRDGAFAEGETALEGALGLDFENGEVLAALKCASFWQERRDRLGTVAEAYEKGEYLLKSWRAFLDFLERVKDASEACLYAMRQWVFGQALANYLRLFEEGGGHDTELLFRIGRCFKGKGDYEHAVEFLEAASAQRRDDPEIIAELADSYAFINEVKAAKAFFREAFFIDPQRIDLKLLESLLIRRLIDRVRELGYARPALEEWIPVYGVVYGVFNIKRELKSLEYGKLRQSIQAIEGHLSDNGGDTEVMIPRLINRYLWLIDHYVSSHDERDKIEEVLAKIKKLSPNIYEQIVN